MVERKRRASLAVVVSALATFGLLNERCGSSSGTPDTGTGGTGAGGSGDPTDDAGARDDAHNDGAGAGSSGDASDAEPRDSGADTGFGGDGAAGPPPHVVFVTSAIYTGDFVGQANAIIAAGAGGIAAPDGGTFGPEDGVAAADALCGLHASKGGRTGTFIAILATWGGADAGGADTWSRVHDEDGPWALPLGDVVATTAVELRQGLLRTAIDVTETGDVFAFDPLVPGDAVAWTSPLGQGTDCRRWASETNDGGNIYGHVGSMRYTGAGWSDRYLVSCATAHPLTCLQLGAGGPKAKLPVAPSGAKIAFISQGTVANDFAVGADAGASADAVHAAADEHCAHSAAIAGRAGTFRAFVSSSSSSARDYFTQLGMNGPWFRPDGFKVASGRADLFRAASSDGGLASGGITNQIEIDATGAFRIQPVYTGTNDDGTTGPNCGDFGAGTSDGGPLTTRGGLPIFKDLEWASRSLLGCAQFTAGALYCFEQ